MTVCQALTIEQARTTEHPDFPCIDLAHRRCLFLSHCTIAMFVHENFAYHKATACLDIPKSQNHTSSHSKVHEFFGPRSFHGRFTHVCT